MVYVADLPPFMQERVTCSIAAAEKYHLPPHYLLAVAERENGRPGQQVRNTNGTYDVGAMQINTAYIRTLSRYGVTQSAVAQPGCYAYYLAAWRIKRHIVYDRKGDIWTKIANYHSYTPKYNAIYRAAIIRLAEKWERWLAGRQGNNAKGNVPTQAVPAVRTIRSQPLPKQYVSPTTVYVPRTIRVVERSPGPEPETVQN